MSSSYKHLTERDRLFLSILLDRRVSKTKIAEILGVHRSTIYREIKRNSTRYRHEPKKYHHYIHFHAQEYYLERRKRNSKLQNDGELRQFVHGKLLKGWSPWQIEGFLRVNNDDKCVISHESIYRYIYSDSAIRNQLYKKLRRRHFWRQKKGARKRRLPKELLIHNRPDNINNRSEFGHWECDLMIFKKGIKSNLITLRERKTRFIIAIKNPNKTAQGTALGLISTLKNIKPLLKSITFDQGSEFSKYAWINECLDTDIYFCDPASPEQKGAVENGNGVIRVELPRSHNIDLLKQKDVTSIVDEINKRPLKCFKLSNTSRIIFTTKMFCDLTCLKI